MQRQEIAISIYKAIKLARNVATHESHAGMYLNETFPYIR